MLYAIGIHVRFHHSNTVTIPVYNVQLGTETVTSIFRQIVFLVPYIQNSSTNNRRNNKELP